MFKQSQVGLIFRCILSQTHNKYSKSFQKCRILNNLHILTHLYSVSLLKDQNVTYYTYPCKLVYILCWGCNHNRIILMIPRTINRSSYSTKQVVRWRNKTADKHRYVRSELKPTKTIVTFILLIIKGNEGSRFKYMYKQLHVVIAASMS